MSTENRNIRTPRSMSEAWGEGATLHVAATPCLGMRIARAMAAISAVIAVAAFCSGCSDDLDMQSAIEADKAQAVLDARAIEEERRREERGEKVAAAYESHRRAILTMNAALSQPTAK